MASDLLSAEKPTETLFWEKKKKVKLLSHVQFFVIPWTIAYQAPPSIGFSRQEFWSGLPFPSLILGEATTNNKTYLQRCDYLSLMFTLPNPILTQLSLFKIIKFPGQSHLWAPEVSKGPVRQYAQTDTAWQNEIKLLANLILHFYHVHLGMNISESLDTLSLCHKSVISWRSITVPNFNNLSCVPKYGSGYTLKKYFKLQLI